jgi:hypothetical protein
MNLNNAMNSTHNLKKSSYKMLRKLHSLEHKGALRTCSILGDEYYIILCLQHMAHVIEEAYPNIDIAEKIISNLKDLIVTLKEATVKRERVSRDLLVSCLKKHTYVFNWLEENKIKLEVTDKLIEMWSIRCLGAYICQFRNKI